MATPLGLRLYLNKQWKSQWYSSSLYSPFFHSDFLLRQYYFNKENSSLNDVVIFRNPNNVSLLLYKQKGTKTKTLVPSSSTTLKIRSVQVKKNTTFLHALPAMISFYVASQLLTGRRSFPRIAEELSTRLNITKQPSFGFLVRCAGSFKGASMASVKWISVGSVPLNTFAASIFYHYLPVHTSHGVIGIKVWVYQNTSTV